MLILIKKINIDVQLFFFSISKYKKKNLKTKNTNKEKWEESDFSSCSGQAIEEKNNKLFYL
jgi:hypoxanthine-guanine phosphoribosyltransferase